MIVFPPSSGHVGPLESRRMTQRVLRQFRGAGSAGCRSTVIVVALVSWAACECSGQTAGEVDPTGGLRGKAAASTTPSGTTREELVRQWDLDGNGTIDSSEAAVAKARMRRGRKQLQRNDGLDPITGRPRATADEDAEPDASPTTPEVPADVPPRAAKRSAPGPALPGTRVPDVAPPRAGRNTSAGRDADGSAPDASADPARPSAARPGEARSGTVTGGVRAGAPAARQGYGSLAPKPDLNAGRPRLDATLPRPAPSRGGGLLPTGRPGQAGGGRSGLQTVPRPSTPAPAPPLQPQPSRVSAEDIGGS
jgi:hypothetical protein